MNRNLMDAHVFKRLCDDDLCEKNNMTPKTGFPTYSTYVHH